MINKLIEISKVLGLNPILDGNKVIFYKNSPVEVPRDCEEGNRMIHKKETSLTQHPSKYSRRVSDCQQIVDKSYKFSEVMKLVRLRKKDIDISKEQMNDINIVSLKLKTKDFRKEALSYKETICLHAIASANGCNSTLKIHDYIYKNYDHGFKSKNTFYQYLVKCKSLVMSSEYSKKFIEYKENSIDLNYSFKFFEELKNEEKTQK